MGKEWIIQLITNEEDSMTRQTAINVIKEGCKTRKFFRIEYKKGNQNAVSYTVYPDVDKDEKFHLIQMEKFLKDFDDRFLIFEDKFSSLSIKDKSEGVEGIILFFIHFSETAGKLWIAYGKKREWKTLLDEVNSRKVSLEKLMKSCPKKEQNIVSRHVLVGNLLYLDEAKGFLDKYIQKIK
jgi:hypothetical protein